MTKFYHIIRGSIAVIIGILAILAFVSAIYPLKFFDIQISALIQRVLVDFSLFAIFLLAGIFLLTLIFGRVYCSTLCPLGLYQELLMHIFRRKCKPQQNHPYKYFIAALVFGALIGGSAWLVRLIDPYTLFGSAMSGAYLGGVILILLVALVWFKGRFFCTNICPVGTILGLISKYSLNKIYIKEDKCVSCGSCAAKCPSGCIDFKNKIVDNETCVKCLKCLDKCPKQAIHYGIKPKEKVSFNPNRRKLLIGGAALVVLAAGIKSGIILSKNIAAKIKKAILPAGAGSAKDFANRCLNCNLCVQNCPMKIIKKADEEHLTVYIDYEDSFCDYNCHKCSEVCPSGAIAKISLEQKQKTQIALAQIDEEKCIKCGLCVMKCPKEAISKEGDAFPKVNPEICIGCGACQKACPVKAIEIVAVEKQKLL